MTVRTTSDDTIACSADSRAGLNTRLFLAFVLSFTMPMIGHTAEITKIDFTSWSELPPDWVYTRGLTNLPGDVELTEQGLSPLDFAAATPNLDTEPGWSIRTKARLSQEDYGALGIRVGRAGDELGLAWIGVDSYGDVIGGPGGSSIPFGSSGLDPTEDFVLQLDAFDNQLRVWAWPPGATSSLRCRVHKAKALPIWGSSEH